MLVRGFRLTIRMEGPLTYLSRQGIILFKALKILLYAFYALHALTFHLLLSGQQQRLTRILT